MKEIRKFYMIFVVGMIVGFVTSGLLISLFSGEDYAKYSLYITIGGYLAILSLGYQDGMLLNYRQKKIENNIKMIWKDTMFFLGFTLIIFICSTIISILFFDSLMSLAIISTYPVLVFIGIRGIFAATEKFVLVGVVDFITKLNLFIAAICLVVFKIDLMTFIWVDIITKYLIAVAMLLYLFMQYKSFKDLKQEIIPMRDSIKRNFSVGISVLLGNWFLVVMYGMDKIILKDDLAVLGVYAKAMSIIAILISILLPAKTLILSKVDKNISSLKLEKYTHQLNLMGLFVAIGYTLCIYPIVIQIPFLASFNEIFEIAKYLIILLPMILNIQILLNNVVMVKCTKKYPYIYLANMLVFALCLIVATRIYGLTIDVVIIATTINYFSNVIFSSIFIMNFKNYSRVIGFLGIAVVVYLFSLYNDVVYLNIITLVLYFGYVFKEKFIKKIGKERV